MAIRAKAIKTYTPKDVIENVDTQILEQDLTEDDWVVNTWLKTSKSEWTKRLSSNKSFLQQSLDQNMTIHASEGLPYVVWVNVIKHYMYLENKIKEEAKSKI